MQLKNFSDDKLTKISKAEYWEPPSGYDEGQRLGELIEKRLDKALAAAYQEGIKHVLQAIRDQGPFMWLEGLNVECSLTGVAPEGEELTITEPLESILKDLEDIEEPWPEMAALLRKYAAMCD